MEIQVRDIHGTLTFFDDTSSDDAVDFALHNDGLKISANGHRFVKYTVEEILENFSPDDIEKYFPGKILRDGNRLYEVYWRDEPLDSIIDIHTRELEWKTLFITTSELRDDLNNLINVS